MMGNDCGDTNRYFAKYGDFIMHCAHCNCCCTCALLHRKDCPVKLLRENKCPTCGVYSNMGAVRDDLPEMR